MHDLGGTAVLWGLQDGRLVLSMLQSDCEEGSMDPQLWAFVTHVSCPAHQVPLARFCLCVACGDQVGCSGCSRGSSCVHRGQPHLHAALMALPSTTVHRVLSSMQSHSAATSESLWVW